MKISVVVHESEEGGYWAEVPSLPGCATQGDTYEDLMLNLKEAIEGWILATSLDNISLQKNSKIVELCL